MHKIFNRIRDLLCHMGLHISKCLTIKRLVHTSKEYNQLSSNLSFLKYIKEDKLKESLTVIESLKSQIQQDLFVLLIHNFKKNGYFVDFGGTNGVYMNNSWILEKNFGWKGIVAEPARVWHRTLLKNRLCHISKKCVWKESGKSIVFNETKEGGYSTIDSYSFSDNHAKLRKNGKQYTVETISLNDLLALYSAPHTIDYLSIDTEGSEYDILVDFNFNKWNIAVITVEHNYTDKREQLKVLLESKGFIRVLSSISQFDDWYIKPNLLQNFNNTFISKVKENIL